MLRSVNSFLGTSVVARDGEIGDVRDLLFHDRSWIVRYLVVDTGNWLSGRRVLISPAVANFSGPASHSLRVNLTKEQVQKSPGIDSDLPVSRQHEIMMATYYGWPAYWAPETLNFPNVVTEPTKVEGDPDLRSATAVKNYAVTTTDGELGHLSDLITEDANWFIRFLVVGTGIWFAGQNLLVATRWVGSISISWSDRAIILPPASGEL